MEWRSHWSDDWGFDPEMDLWIYGFMDLWLMGYEGAFLPAGMG